MQSMSAPAVSRHRFTVLCGLSMLVLLIAVPVSGVQAQDTAAPPAASSVPIRDVEPVVVSGALPGPGMWKVRKGEHTLYVLGTMSPVPRGMDWTSGDVEKVLAEADERSESTRLNSSHSQISYAVFCLKKKTKKQYIY